MKKKHYKYWYNFLTEFKNSPDPFVELKVEPGKYYISAASLQSTALAAIKRYNIGGIRTVAFCNRVYLIKEDQ